MINCIYIRFWVVAGCGGLVTGACVVTGAGAAEEALSKLKSKVKSKLNSKFKSKQYKAHLSYFHDECHITSFESLLYDTRQENKITILQEFSNIDSAQPGYSVQSTTVFPVRRSNLWPLRNAIN